ncbi:unnamed protein product [Vitrella brassicaformis CCMP3155]|uniref:Uncharacterized protein n=1 Tax=Vitrella brassicaformis (strain CCMP3155) TaxID=1169540 RepID=A0A0G4FH82_VITBC|nr:unnamed protein product [Vitrella brassicaformis CCMP3155]|eukprot:CEM12869.1 unnamed protein product [Vitrella brassicaformis CCMP3155]
MQNHDEQAACGGEAEAVDEPEGEATVDETVRMTPPQAEPEQDTGETGGGHNSKREVVREEDGKGGGAPPMREQEESGAVEDGAVGPTGPAADTMEGDAEAGHAESNENQGVEPLTQRQGEAATIDTEETAPEDENKDDPQQAAATLLQSHWRGHQSRRHTAERRLRRVYREQPGADEGHTEHEGENTHPFETHQPDLAVTAAEQTEHTTMLSAAADNISIDPDRAVTRLQAQWRGHQARKAARRGREEASVQVTVDQEAKEERAAGPSVAVEPPKESGMGEDAGGIRGEKGQEAADIPPAAIKAIDAEQETQKHQQPALDEKADVADMDDVEDVIVEGPMPVSEADAELAKEAATARKHLAATRLQAHWRGYNTRRSMSTANKPRQHQQREEEDLACAATKVQAHWRGHKTRKSALVDHGIKLSKKSVQRVLSRDRSTSFSQLLPVSPTRSPRTSSRVAQAKATKRTRDESKEASLKAIQPPTSPPPPPAPSRKPPSTTLRTRRLRISTEDKRPPPQVDEETHEGDRKTKEQDEKASPRARLRATTGRFRMKGPYAGLDRITAIYGPPPYRTFRTPYATAGHWPAADAIHRTEQRRQQDVAESPKGCSPCRKGPGRAVTRSPRGSIVPLPPLKIATSPYAQTPRDGDFAKSCPGTGRFNALPPLLDFGTTPRAVPSRQADNHSGRRGSGATVAMMQIVNATPRHDGSGFVFDNRFDKKGGKPLSPTKLVFFS